MSSSDAKNCCTRIWLTEINACFHHFFHHFYRGGSAAEKDCTGDTKESTWDEDEIYRHACHQLWHFPLPNWHGHSHHPASHWNVLHRGWERQLSENCDADRHDWQDSAFFPVSWQDAVWQAIAGEGSAQTNNSEQQASRWSQVWTRRYGSMICCPSCLF